MRYCRETQELDLKRALPFKTVGINNLGDCINMSFEFKFSGSTDYGPLPEDLVMWTPPNRNEDTKMGIVNITAKYVKEKLR